MRSSISKAFPEERARSIQMQLGEKFPDLSVSAAGSEIRIRGSFPLTYDGKVLDRYEIEIEWSDSDMEAPILWETGGRIPRSNERHISKDGRACPLVQEEWLILPPATRTVIHYLEGPVHGYFLWQSLTEQGITPPGGQRTHGKPGLLEAYGEMVGMQGEKAVKLCLEYLSRDRIKGHWPCVCGSGARLRNCHIRHVQDLQGKVPRRIARLALKRLENPTMR